MGLTAPIGTTMDPRAALNAPKAEPLKPQASTETTEQETAKPQQAEEATTPEPPKEIVKVAPTTENAKPEPAPEQQQAALAPQRPTETPAPVPTPTPMPMPKLENALPPLEAPPPPLTSREIAPPAPPPPPPPPPKPAPQPAPRVQTPPPAAAHAPVPQRQLPPSPLSHPPQQQHPPASQQAARPAPSPLVNPAEVYGQRKAQEDYLWGVVRRISQHRYYPRSARENSEEGLVVTLVTIARDGRLIDVSISRSSGYRSLDNAVLDVIRQAAPYPPLPSDMTGDRHTFILPLNYRRSDPR